MARTTPAAGPGSDTGPVPGGGSGVNGSLTPRHDRESADLAAAIARMVRGLGRRAGEGDLQALVEMKGLEQTLARELLRAAQALHNRHGYSWQDVGIAAGMTRQAAHQRWAKGPGERP